MNAPVTIGVLTFGDYPNLVNRCIDSIVRNSERWLYRLVVGANAPSDRVLRRLRLLADAGVIDRLVASDENLNKCPMMRRMWEGESPDYFWWFDDDSHVTEPGTLSRWLEIARRSPPDTAMWGHVWYSREEDFSLGQDVKDFVRKAPWFRGLPPPSEEGDPRWFFATGGCWMIRASALRALDWPDPALVKHADDVLLGEACRQNGWRLHDLGELGIRINQAERRGGGEDEETMRLQMTAR